MLPENSLATTTVINTLSQVDELTRNASIAGFLTVGNLPNYLENLGTIIPLLDTLDNTAIRNNATLDIAFINRMAELQESFSGDYPSGLDFRSLFQIHEANERTRVIHERLELLWNNLPRETGDLNLTDFLSESEREIPASWSDEMQTLIEEYRELSQYLQITNQAFNERDENPFWDTWAQDALFDTSSPDARIYMALQDNPQLLEDVASDELLLPLLSSLLNSEGAQDLVARHLLTTSNTDDEQTIFEEAVQQAVTTMMVDFVGNSGQVIRNEDESMRIIDQSYNPFDALNAEIANLRNAQQEIQELKASVANLSAQLTGVAGLQAQITRLAERISFVESATSQRNILERNLSNGLPPATISNSRS